MIEDQQDEGCQYYHRQVGKILISTFCVLILVIGGEAVFISELTWFLLPLALLFLVPLLFFTTLSVTVCREKIIVSFGPVSVIKKTIPLNQVASFAVVKNPWYYGWGIRLIPNGTMYNVSGFIAIELQFNSGKVFRIGTDDPDNLARVLGMVTGIPVRVDK